MTNEEREYIGLEDVSRWKKIKDFINSIPLDIVSIFIKPKEFSRENVAVWFDGDWDAKECNDDSK